MPTTSKFMRSEEVLRTAQEFAGEAQEFLTLLDHRRDEDFFSGMKDFSRKLLSNADNDFGRTLQTQLAKSGPRGITRRLNTEIHMLMHFTIGSRSPQSYVRVRELLTAIIGLPTALEPVMQRA